MTIILADIPNNTTLTISDGVSNFVVYENRTITSFSRDYESDKLLNIIFNDLNDSVSKEWNGFLIKYEAFHIEKPENKISDKKYIWIIVAIVVFLVIMVIVIIAVWFIRRGKKREERYEKLLEIFKEMNLSTNEINAMASKSDEFLIKDKNLQIYFSQEIGQGSTSSVYKGHLIGISPLHISIKSIQTQRFVDCDVAVKVASNFGQDEAGNLLQEINAMKQIGHHKNIISFLGWCMHKGTPCLAFELAKMDLLIYVRSFREKIEEVPQRSFLSILWQISQGK